MNKEQITDKQVDIKENQKNNEAFKNGQGGTNSKIEYACEDDQVDINDLENNNEVSTICLRGKSSRYEKKNDIKEIENYIEDNNSDMENNEDDNNYDDSNYEQDEDNQQQQKNKIKKKKQKNKLTLSSINKSKFEYCEIEKILQGKLIGNQIHVKVRWQDFSSEHDQWINQTKSRAIKLLQCQKNLLTKIHI
ncbi:Chromo domain containing protein [Oxytricha trifallax]|uniref:Chromo domain containing protein n=1 Tax=Oxytricha trifallax TaxID=1172189 RepID=A0A073ICI8_9SPIT|nr:Chromo domain containing protein [Oxytricha trifallax]